MSLKVVILAAGMGSRMRSALPKVLHKIAGKPMIEHVIDIAEQLNAKDIQVVYGHAGDVLQEALSHKQVTWVHQAEQLGTGHAVQQVLPHIDDNDQVLILYGDVPLISKNTLERLLDLVKQNSAALLSIELDNPTGYGRILHKNQDVSAIVEEKDADDEQRQIKEVNTGIFAVNGDLLQRWLKQINNNNAQKEYYLTDIVELAYNDNQPLKTLKINNEMEVTGVNDRRQLALLERAYQRSEVTRLLSSGVTFIDPERADIRGEVTIGQDTVVDVNVIFEGKVTVGSGVTIGANVILKDCTIADNVTIAPMSIIEGAHVGESSTVGPFARLRPDTHLAGHNRVGNFVEMKKAHLGLYSKANHLTYLGDSTIGQHVNIGAGTITCNYDGANKHQTTIGDHVFVGSGTQLIAPVTLENNVTIGAGSTITGDVSENNLSLTRVKQKNISGWKRPQKNKK